MITSIELVISGFIGSVFNALGFGFADSLPPSPVGGIRKFFSGDVAIEFIGTVPFLGPIVGANSLELRAIAPFKGPPSAESFPGDRFDYNWRINVIPEPSTALLLSLGLLALGARRRT